MYNVHINPNTFIGEKKWVVFPGFDLQTSRTPTHDPVRQASLSNDFVPIRMFA